MIVAAWMAAEATASELTTTSGIDEPAVQAVVADPRYPSIAYTGTVRGVYKTQDGGKSWARILTLPLSNGGVRKLFIDPLNPRRVYAGTDRGLYRTANEGVRWQRVFRGVGAEEARVNSICAGGNGSKEIYLGTDAGIFVSKRSGRSWEKLPVLQIERILRVAPYAASPDTLLVMTTNSLYTLGTKTLKTETILVQGHSSQTGDNLEASRLDAPDLVEETQTEPDFPSLRAFVENSEDKSIVVAGSNGVLLTKSQGQNWTTLSEEGLLSRRVHDLVFSAGGARELLAATDRGIFRYQTETERWEEIALSENPGVVRDMDAQPKDDQTIWAATSRGIFRFQSSTPPDSPSAGAAASNRPLLDWQSLLLNFKNEPNLSELRQAAIRYAEVHPEKIQKWRRGAQQRALLPTLSVGAGQNIRRTVEVDRGGTSDPDQFIIGPKDRDFSFDVKLSWDLADLIWNETQTSIDVRSKLMVELRDDLLNSLTKYYFERRRLQIELIQSPPQDPSQRLEKELRLQELTAHVDALTGNYLSKKLDGENEGG